ncbi:hypothetical protein [Epilithonimonas hominis]|nr:hypothetical protein [Epilithonimonas hominis]
MHYYLKQYNNRWFLFGVFEEDKTSFKIIQLIDELNLNENLG